MSEVANEQDDYLQVIVTEISSKVIRYMVFVNTYYLDYVGPLLWECRVLKSENASKCLVS